MHTDMKLVVIEIFVFLMFQFSKCVVNFFTRLLCACSMNHVALNRISMNL